MTEPEGAWIVETDPHYCDPPKKTFHWAPFSLPAAPIGSVWRCHCGVLHVVAPGVFGSWWTKASWRLRFKYRKHIQAGKHL